MSSTNHLENSFKVCNIANCWNSATHSTLMPSKLETTCQLKNYISPIRNQNRGNENIELLSLENMNSLITFTYPVLLACLTNSSDDSEPENKSSVTLVGMIQRKVTCLIQWLSSHTCLLLSTVRCFQLLADEIKFSCEVFT